MVTNGIYTGLERDNYLNLYLHSMKIHAELHFKNLLDINFFEVT